MHTYEKTNSRNYNNCIHYNTLFSFEQLDPKTIIVFSNYIYNYLVT
jgi:hypothetical protein